MTSFVETANAIKVQADALAGMNITDIVTGKVGGVASELLSLTETMRTQISGLAVNGSNGTNGKGIKTTARPRKKGRFAVADFVVGVIKEAGTKGSTGVEVKQKLFAHVGETYYSKATGGSLVYNVLARLHKAKRIAKRGDRWIVK